MVSALVDRITAVLAEHLPTTRRQPLPYRPGTYWNRPACTGCDWLGEGHLLQRAHRVHVAERVAEALRPELGELEATKLLLAATQEQHYRTIADFCAVRDALPREQVEQILAAVEPKPAEEKP